MKTDLQKYKDFFDEINIGYKIKHDENHIFLCIGYKHIFHLYGNAIEIEFDENEKFICFHAWGE